MADRNLTPRFSEEAFMARGPFVAQIWRDRHQPTREAMKPPPPNLRGASSILGSRWLRTDFGNLVYLKFSPHKQQAERLWPRGWKTFMKAIPPGWFRVVGIEEKRAPICIENLPKAAKNPSIVKYA